MKSFALLILSFLICISVLQAQTQWVTQQSGTTKHLYSVNFRTSAMGWVVGAEGTILKTNNGGNAWVAQTSNTINDLRSVFFSSNQRGWAVGVQGTILNTVNGGSTWSQQPTNFLNALFSVHFMGSVGLAVGSNGKIVRTTNNGTTWANRSSKTTQNLNSVTFVNASVAWAVGDSGTIRKTINGGLTWSIVASPISNRLNEVFFLNESDGWIVGDNRAILKTSNGGATWLTYSANINGDDYVSAKFSVPYKGWLITDKGLIYRSAPYSLGGEFSIYQNIPFSLRSLALFGNSMAWAVGTNGVILKYAGPTTLPGCPTILSPTQGQTEVENDHLAAYWAPGTGVTSGYLVNGTDAGNVLGYGLNIDTYYGNTGSVQVYPYNDAGTNYSCPTNFFTLKSNPTAGDCADDNWTLLTPNPSPNYNFWDVEFPTANTGYLLNDFSILKTTDGGSTWNNICLTDQIALYGLYFINADTGWVNGYHGLIMKTVDGGASWTSYHAPLYAGQYFRNIYFYNAEIGWGTATNGKIFKTSNGGATWTLIDTGSQDEYWSAFFTSPDTGYVVGGNNTISTTCLKTTDGGITWTAQTLPQTLNFPPYRLYDVIFKDSQNGLACGVLGIYQTNNGGETWTKQSDIFRIRDIDYGVGNTVWAVRQDGAILRSDDLGSTWSIIYTSTDDTKEYFCGDFSNPNRYVVAGRVLLNSTDQGSSWQLNGLYDDLFSADFFNPNLGWACGRKGLYKTTNGGNTWNLTQTLSSNNYITTINAPSSNVIYAVGNQGLVYKSSGTNWTQMPNNITATLVDAHFVNNNRGWVCGDYSIYRTINGGTSWVTQFTDATYELAPIALHFVNSNVGWALDVFKGGIIKTSDGGTNWNVVSYLGNNTSQMGDIYFVDELTGWAVGQYNGLKPCAILKTTDGGLTWTPQRNGVIGSKAESVYFADANTGWVMLSSGAVLYTSNGGASWNLEVLPVSDNNGQIVGLDENNVWVVGSSGLTVKRDATPKPLLKTLVEEESDWSPILYPNPTNGLLHFNDVPSSTAIQIYNVVGQWQVQTIYNDAPIDVSDFESGVYFVILTNGEQRKTLKFVKS